MILVTGGTGLVGGHLLFRFRESVIPIKAIYRHKDSILKTKAIFKSYGTRYESHVDHINWVQADITDVNAVNHIMDGITTVYHCAALIDGTYEQLKRTNVYGTENIVNACIFHKVKTLCYVSSIATLGDAIGNRAVNEEDYFNLDGRHTNYALTKYGAEMETWRAAQEGVNTVIVNPGVILGEGNWNSGSGQLFTKIKKGWSYYTTGGSGFIDVYDVVDSMILFVEKAIYNERFILVSNNNSYRQVLSIIAKCLNKKAPHRKVNRWLLVLISIITKPLSWMGFKRSLSMATVDSLTTTTVYDSAKIKKLINKEFNSLENTISRVSGSL